MKLEKDIRVRFAPSPTGFMHLGNVRAALVNYLFSNQKNGTFILRIEDTDKERNIGPEAILNDLRWLNLQYEEGPYYQSERFPLYQEYLEVLKTKKLVYRCFCTPEELQKKREKQLALKHPPRYDRACCKLSFEESDKQAQTIPFIWRFKLDYEAKVIFYDLAHKEMTFDLKHFSDVPLTRQDGSFTFLFANFVDDYTMKISHVFRGEDHLTNTAVQVAIYNAFDADLPVFWHLPIMGNKEGKKLSKRDFGFSLTDLRDAGFLPEALCNYLAIIGGSYANEIMSMKELINAIDFDHISPTGQIKYDLEKLKWVNHQWILKTDLIELTEKLRPILEKKYSQIKSLNDQELSQIIKPIQEETVTLLDSVELLRFYFEDPSINDIKDLLEKHNYTTYNELLNNIILEIKNINLDPEGTYNLIKSSIKNANVSMKEILTIIRIALTGKASGLGIKDLLEILSKEVIIKRLINLIS